MSRKKKSLDAPLVEADEIESASVITDETKEAEIEATFSVEAEAQPEQPQEEAVANEPMQSSELTEDIQEETEADNEPSAEASELEAASKSIEELTSEIKLLKEQIEKLEELKRSQNRILAEIGDFVALFPEIPIEEIPDTVWESVKQGAPLAASYALYEKRMVAEAKRIAEINAKNAKKSPGAAGKDTAGEYFSPEDVRRMSRAEVHANYSKIKDSMKKWM
jgi:hypothetical protein